MSEVAQPRGKAHVRLLSELVLRAEGSVGGDHVAEREAAKFKSGTAPRWNQETGCYRRPLPLSGVRALRHRGITWDLRERQNLHFNKNPGDPDAR